MKFSILKQGSVNIQEVSVQDSGCALVFKIVTDTLFPCIKYAAFDRGNHNRHRFCVNRTNKPNGEACHDTIIEIDIGRDDCYEGAVETGGTDSVFVTFVAIGIMTKMTIVRPTL